jgi:hypothetical protein
VVGRASALLGPRGAAFAALAAALGVYFGVHESLPDLSLWADVAFLALLVIPAVFGLVYCVLPFWRSPPLELLVAGLAFAALAVVLALADLQSLADFAKLGATTALAWVFLRYFESVSWVVLVALIVPWVDAYSVWRGPTHHIIKHRKHVFLNLSFSFPVPGESNTANLGLPDLLFFALYLGTAARFGLRVFWTWVGLVAGLGATITVATWSNEGLPALPLLSLGFLLPNADLLWRALRKPRPA